MVDLLISLSVTLCLPVFLLFLRYNLGSPQPHRVGFPLSPSSTSLPPALTRLHLWPSVPHFTSVSSQAKAGIAWSPTTTRADPQPEPTPMSAPPVSLLSYCRLHCELCNSTCFHRAREYYLLHPTWVCLIHLFKPFPGLVVCFWVLLQTPTNGHTLPPAWLVKKLL